MPSGLNTKLTGVHVNKHAEVSRGLCTGHNILVTMYCAQHVCKARHSYIIPYKLQAGRVFLSGAKVPKNRDVE